LTNVRGKIAEKAEFECEMVYLMMIVNGRNVM
jgi:hypothetical protein